MAFLLGPALPTNRSAAETPANSAGTAAFAAESGSSAASESRRSSRAALVLLDALCLVVVLSAVEALAVPATTQILSLNTNDLVYDPASALLYASTASGLTAINPLTGTVVANYPIAGSPGKLVIASDSSYIHAVVDDGRAVQRFNLQTHDADLKFTMPGSGEWITMVGNIVALPGRPDSVLISRTFTGAEDGGWVYRNGVALPNHVAGGAGNGGPVTLCVGDNGTAYGYGAGGTSYDFGPMPVDDNGVGWTVTWPWGNMISGNVTHMEVAKGKLFPDFGDVKDLATATSVGSFDGRGNFCVSAADDRLYSVQWLHSSEYGRWQNTVRAYDLDNLNLVDSLDVLGDIGDTSDLTRFGSNGLAFRTDTQLILVQSSMVPEPGTLVLLAAGGIGLLTCALTSRHLVRRNTTQPPGTSVAEVQRL
jgi:trimeric autotransporter adhesin